MPLWKTKAHPQATPVAPEPAVKLDPSLQVEAAWTEPLVLSLVNGTLTVHEQLQPTSIVATLGGCERPHCTKEAIMVREYSMSNLGTVRQNVCSDHSSTQGKSKRKKGGQTA